MEDKIYYLEATQEMEALTKDQKKPMSKGTIFSVGFDDLRRWLILKGVAVETNEKSGAQPYGFDFFTKDSRDSKDFERFRYVEYYFSKKNLLDEDLEKIASYLAEKGGVIYQNKAIDTISKKFKIKKKVIEDLINEKKTPKKKEMKTTSKTHIEFILDEAEEPQTIDHALGFLEIDGELKRYFGTFIYARGFKQVTGRKEVIEKEKKEVIITEDKEILSAENGGFSFHSKMGNSVKRWELNSIKNFKESSSYENISFKEVFEAYKRIFSESMVYEKEEWYDVLALWCMTTYFQDMLSKSLIIKVEGDSGTAKSKTGRIVTSLAFNGKKFLCPTPANFFRYRHNFKATLFIEEAERLFDDSKGKQTGDSELVEYLNGSYEKGNSVPRQNDKNINQTDEFDPYGWTMIGSIKPLKGALHKRSITLYQIKAKKGDKRGDIEVSADDKIFIEPRNKMYVLALTKYKTYRETFEKLDFKFGLSNREWLVAKPVISMAYCISEALGQSVGNFIAERFEVRDEELSEESWEFRLIIILLEKLQYSKESNFISTHEIKEKLVQVTGWDRLTPHKTTSLMTGLGFADYKARNPERTLRGFSLSFFLVCEIVLRNNKITPQNIAEILPKKVSEVSEVSDNKIYRRDFIEWYADTFSDKDTFIKEFSDTSDGQDTLFRGINKKNTLFFTLSGFDFEKKGDVYLIPREQFNTLGLKKKTFLGEQGVLLETNKESVGIIAPWFEENILKNER